MHNSFWRRNQEHALAIALFCIKGWTVHRQVRVIQLCSTLEQLYHYSKMNSTTSTVSKLVALCAVLAVLVGLLATSEATYRKPPFNGSIFGKRGSTTEYDSTGKALSAMCEIANEACQTWFPNQEK